MNWYFHRYGSKGYKSGTYKGLDLTFGTKLKNLFGGILIRSIQNLSTGELIEGSCNCVTAIFKQFGVSEVNEFLDKVQKGFDKTKVLDSSNVIHIVENDKAVLKHEIFKSSRVGLTLKGEEEERFRFIFKNYRFMLWPNKIKKGKA